MAMWNDTNDSHVTIGLLDFVARDFVDANCLTIVDRIITSCIPLHFFYLESLGNHSIGCAISTDRESETFPLTRASTSEVNLLTRQTEKTVKVWTLHDTRVWRLRWDSSEIFEWSKYYCCRRTSNHENSIFEGYKKIFVKKSWRFLPIAISDFWSYKIRVSFSNETPFEVDSIWAARLHFPCIGNESTNAYDVAKSILRSLLCGLSQSEMSTCVETWQALRRRSLNRCDNAKTNDF